MQQQVDLVKQNIADVFFTPANNTITGLKGRLAFYDVIDLFFDMIGDLDNLNDPSNTIIEAINQLQSASGQQTQIFDGLIPPTNIVGAVRGDFYIEYSGSTDVFVYLFDGSLWIPLNSGGNVFLGERNTVNEIELLQGSNGDYATLLDGNFRTLYMIIGGTWRKVGNGKIDSDGKNIELRVNDGAIQWSLEGEDNWEDLFLLDDITPDFRVVDSVFEYRQTPTSPWVEITDFSDFHPTIGSNGNWWIDGQDTGVSATAMPTTIYDNDISGIRDGVNTEFLAPDQFVIGSLAVYLDGIRLSKGNNMDYVEATGGSPIVNGRGAIINRVITPQNKLIFEYVKI